MEKCLTCDQLRSACEMLAGALMKSERAVDGISISVRAKTCIEEYIREIAKEAIEDYNALKRQLAGEK